MCPPQAPLKNYTIFDKYEKEDVCKNLEVKRLRIDRVMIIVFLIRNYPQIHYNERNWKEEIKPSHLN